MATMTVKIDRDILEMARESRELRALSPRGERLYSRLQERMLQRQLLWGEGLSVLEDPEVAGLPLVLRKARAFERTLLEMPIAIEEDDLIVGNVLHQGRIVRPMMPRYATDKELQQAQAEGKTITYALAHKTPYYADLMGKGLKGILAEIEEQIAVLGESSPGEEHAQALVLLQAMRIEAQATIRLAHRFADLAQAQAQKAPSPDRRAELLRIESVCRHVPEHPPRTFQEAIQAFWFIHLALFCTHVQLACGRLDQFLYPPLQAELDAGTITLAEAQELVDCLWIRFNDRAQIKRENFVQGDKQQGNDGGDTLASTSSRSPLRSGILTDDRPRPWAAGHRKRIMLASDLADAVNHWGQNILLSGIRPDGEDGTNPLTYLCLNAHEKFSFTSPVVTVRLHKGSPAELVHRVAEVLKNDGSGMPYIDNDDVIIPAYVKLGVPIEDARDYANSNCWETLIQGKSDQEMIRGVNFLLLLELALHRGYSQMHGQMGPDTGDPRQFTTFADLMAAWKTQLDHLVKEGIAFIGTHIAQGTLDHSGHGKYNDYPLLSSLTRDCIAKGKDVTRGGARYTIWHVMGEVLANTIDALAAIKRLVFEQHTLTMDELLTALDNDWQGYEQLRLTCANLGAKFANDDPYADEIGRELMDHFVETVRIYAEPWRPLVLFPCSVGTFSWIASIGKEVAASADGRHAGEPVAANLSPAPGADTSGPIAALNSSFKMRVEELAAGAPMDLRLSKGALRGEAGTQRLAALLKGFIASGGNMLVLTVSDVEELKRAMVEPDRYRGLRIRMGGWSAYFVMLSREQQLLHIRRVEHGLA